MNNQENEAKPKRTAAIDDRRGVKVVRNQLLTTEEAARRIGVKQTTVRTWLNNGLLAGTKVGGGKLWRIREEALEEFLNNKSYRATKKQRTS